MSDGDEKAAWFGRDSAWALEAWVSAHPGTTGLRLLRPPTPPPPEGRAQLAPGERDVVRRGSSLNQQTNLPFWDAVLVSSFAGEGPMDGIIEAASFHNASAGEGEHFACGEDVAERLRSRWAGAVDGRYLAVSSSVERAGRARGHIPMLDFHVPPSGHGLGLVKSVLKHARAGAGYVLVSGRSYHFYGDELLDRRGLTQFLARCLLCAPVIDRAWVAHQLLEEAAALRISPKVDGGEPPRVVARVG